MSESHSYRTVIPSVPKSEYQPLWSVMIPTFNCAHYLRETLASVLAQDPGPELMQIEVIDDCSTKDDPKSVVEELGKGRIAFYRQPENVGYLKNFDTCIQRSQGKLVHILHGDDCVREGFYHKMQSAFEKQPEIGAAICRHIYTDEHGNWQSISLPEEPESRILSNWMEQVAAKHRIQPPSIVVKREVYENLGGFDHRIGCACEDWEMWARIGAHYPIWYEAEPLAMYRVQSQSLTKRCIRTGQNIQDIFKVISIINEYLPKEHADRITKMSLEHNALSVLYIVENLLTTGELNTAMIQLKGALQLSSSPKVIYSLTRLLARSMVQGIKSNLTKQQLATSVSNS